MVINKSHGIVKTLNYPACLKGRKLKRYQLPSLDHFIQTILYVELFCGLLGCLQTYLNMLQQTHAQSL
jgi:hypothetical protein